MFGEVTRLLAGVPRGLWLAALVYATAVGYHRMADDDRGEWLVGLSLLVAAGSVLVAPPDRFLIEPYYVWAEYNFMGIAEWILLAVVPKLAAVFLSVLFVPIVGLVAVSPVLLLTRGSTESSGSTNSLNQSYSRQSSDTDTSMPSDYVELGSTDRPNRGSQRKPPSEVSENDGVKYNDKGELVRDE